MRSSRLPAPEGGRGVVSGAELLPKFDRHWPMCAKCGQVTWSNSGNKRKTPTLAEFGQSLANSDQHLASLLADVGHTLANVCPNWSTSAKSWPTLANVDQHLANAKFGGALQSQIAELGPKFTNSGRILAEAQLRERRFDDVCKHTLLRSRSWFELPESWRRAHLCKVSMTGVVHGLPEASPTGCSAKNGRSALAGACARALARPLPRALAQGSATHITRTRLVPEVGSSTLACEDASGSAAANPVSRTRRRPDPADKVKACKIGFAAPTPEPRKAAESEP